MNLKLFAFAVLVVSGTAVSGMQQRSWSRQPSAEAGAVVLLPDSIGERRIVKRWNNPQRSGAIEEGAVYAAGSDTSVQLDFFRNSGSAHNGVGCYLLEGESLAWERTQTLRMADASAEFDVALLSSNEGLRLVAATECGPLGCTEHGLWGAAVIGSELRWQGYSKVEQSVVPVSIMLASPLDGEDPAAVEARLMSKLEDVIGKIDLAPAQKLASLQ